MEKETDLKNYYTVAEIISGLRSEYQKLRAALGELQDLLVVDTDKKVNANLYFNAMDGWQDKDLRGVFARIERPYLPDRIWQKYLDKYFSFEMECYETLCYSLKEVNGNLFFTDDTPGYLKHDYIRSVSFKDIEAAKRSYAKIQRLYFYNYPSFSTTLNIYQSLYVEGYFIYFSNVDSKNGEINIVYDAMSDDIRVISNTTCYPYFLEKLLETEIYPDKIPPELRSLINSNKIQSSKVDVEGKIKYRKESFELSENKRGLVLKKKLV